MPYRSVAIASGASYGCWIGSPLVSRCLKGCKAVELNPIWPITIGGDRRLAIPSLHFWRSVRIPWQKFQTHKIHKLHTPLQSGPGRALGLGLLEAFSEVPKCAKCRSNMVQRQLISKALVQPMPLCRWLVAWFAAGLWIMKSSLCRNASIDHATRCLDIYL